MTINVYKTGYALCNGGQMQSEHVVTKEKNTCKCVKGKNTLKANVHKIMQLMSWL